MTAPPWQQLQAFPKSSEVYAHWRSKYLKDYGNTMKYVAYNLAHDAYPENAVTTSESNGYGMLISVLSNQRDDFDKLFAFYQDHTTTQGLMVWQQLLDSNDQIYDVTDKNSTNAIYTPATDGDLDAAYALLLAGKRWGGNYTAQGKQVCQALFNFCISKDSGLTLASANSGGGHDGISRSSDWMLAHFLLFSQLDTDRAQGWKGVLQRAIETYKFNNDWNNKEVQQGRASKYSGLVADFYVYDTSSREYYPAKGKVREKDQDKDYNYNACRVPWRLAAYLNVVGLAGAQDILPVLKAFEAFFVGVLDSGNRVTAGYTLAGDKIQGQDYTDLAFTAPAWCLLKAMNTRNGAAAQKLEGQILQEIQNGYEDQYYGVSILLLAMLQLEQGQLDPQPIPTATQ